MPDLCSKMSSQKPTRWTDELEFTAQVLHAVVQEFDVAFVNGDLASEQQGRGYNAYSSTLRS
jgi:hypothetical protein